MMKVQRLYMLIWMVAATMLVARNEAAEFTLQKYGAKADGKSDDSMAITKAFTDACKSVDPSRLVIPKGTYMVGPIKFTGPCQAPITIQADGAVFIASVDPAQFKNTNGWIFFQSINNFTMTGGTFDGQGKTAWKQNDWGGENCLKSGKCASLPINLQFYKITNSVIKGMASLDSKQFHMNLLHCKNMTLQGIKITAPEESLNTDGIHIGRSSFINITDADIKTGDDCISLGDGSQNIDIQKVRCGPGHGIAIGSLGRYNNEQEVHGVRVKNCTLTNTMFGTRLKTWPASPLNGVARDLHFDDIIMNNVSTPILIDQEYCPHNQCNLKAPSKIKISEVSFKNIRGTSASKVAMKLQCSKGNPCQNVELSNINLAYHGTNGSATTECGNIKPTLTGQLFPPVCASAA